jgi:signal transduction histidine kinase/CheY-like chemotaxis protein
MTEDSRPLRARALARLGQRWRDLREQWINRIPEPPEVTAEYLRLIYRNLSVSSPVSLFFVIYLTVQADFEDPTALNWWATVFCIYLALRWVIGLSYPRKGEVDRAAVPFWSALSLAVQGCNGVLISLLALFVLPTVDPFAQIVGTMVVLILVGAIAHSLSGRWIETLVYAPPIYFSFAWSSWQQDHPYSRGVGLLILALFVLHLVYAGNQRRSIVASFAVARRNADLARELQFKNLEFQELASARSRLLATVSHDLRQPAHAIGLLSERALLETSFAGVKANLRDLNELSQSLSASLATLMDLTRLDAGLVKATIGPVSVAQVLMRVEAEFGGSTRAKGLSLVVERSDAWVQSDAVLLHGVLSNLVSNAIKYTRAGQVEVRVKEDGDAVLIEVSDTGIGIHGEKLELIFKEFVRLDASDSGTEGLGLGLSIVRRYATLLSHPLSVRSEPGQGSTFGITLVRTAPATVSDQASAVLAGAGPTHNPLVGLNVLVVDNVELLLQSMSQTLKGWGCRVQAARNMAEAQRLSQESWPDVVLSDHHLGDREPNGIELIAGLRMQGTVLGLPAPPALLMTGDVSAQLEAEAQVASVRVMHKPVRPRVLQLGLIDLLEGGRHPNKSEAASPLDGRD